MRKTVLLSTVALLAGIGVASAQAPGQAQSGGSSQAQSQRHEGSTVQQKEQPGQARHEQGATQSMPGKSGTAAQGQPQRNEGKAQREQTTGQNAEKQKPAARSEGNRERTTGQGGQAASQPQQGQKSQTPQTQQGQQPQQGMQGRNGQQAQQPQQSTQGRNSQQTQQRQLSPQQGQATTGAANQQQGQARSGAATQQQTGQAGRAGNATVTLNESQRTRIRETVLARSDVPRVDRVDFALTVGTFVPERVLLVAVPEELITIRPEWREDMYFVSGDDIIIVDRGHHIVAVVAAGPATAMNSREYGSYASTRGTSVNLSTEEIRQLQIALNQKGFDVGNPDGMFGARTRQALIAFQRQQGFQATGQIDQQTMAALGVSGNKAGAASTGQGGAASSTGQGGTSNVPAASPSESSTGGRGSSMPSSTSGQGTSGSTNMPPHTQGSSGSTNMPSHTQGSSGSTNLPSHTEGSGSTKLPSGQSR